MAKAPRTVIGINPGSRYVGYAVIRDGDLREWGVKAFLAKNSQKKFERTKKPIIELIGLYEPTVLSMKETHPSRRSPYLNKLVITLKSIGRSRKIPIFEYDIETLREQCAGNEMITNKKKLAEAMAAEFPALNNDLAQEKKHKRPYHVIMFEAVALAAAGYRKLDGYRRSETIKDIEPAAAL